MLIMDYAQHVGMGFGEAWRGVLFRRSYKQLADLVARTRRWFPLIFPQAKFNESDMVWKFAQGEQLLLRYFARLADYDEYHGWEIPWLGWEELTTHPSRDGYEKMKSTSRSSFPGMPRKIRANTNPMGVGHNWVRHDFINQAPEGTLFGPVGRRKCHIFSSIEENPNLLVADPEYIKKLEEIRDPNLRKAWRYGSWDVVAGGMFDDLWDMRAHVIDPFRIPKTWRVDRAFDWGSSRPFSVGWFAESDGSEVEIEPGVKYTFPRGTIFRIAEWYGWNGNPDEGVKMIAPEIARGILERQKFLGVKVNPGPADSSIYDTVNGICIADQMATVGVGWTKADKTPGSRKNGWDRIRTLLQNTLPRVEGGHMEHPGFMVFNTCTQFLRCFPVASRDEKNTDDVDTDSEDHILDEFRYRALNVASVLSVRKLTGT